MGKMDTRSFQSDLPVDDPLLPRAPAPMGGLRRSSPQREVSSPHLTGVFEFFIIQAPLPDSSVMNIVNFGRASADSGFRKCFDVSCQMDNSANYQQIVEFDCGLFHNLMSFVEFESKLLTHGGLNSI